MGRVGIFCVASTHRIVGMAFFFPSFLFPFHTLFDIYIDDRFHEFS